MLSVETYLQIRARLVELGHGEDYTWSETLKPPTTAEAMACEYVWVVLNSGMRNTVARKIFDRVWPRVSAGEPISRVFGHKGKVAAIEHVWSHRADYFTCLQAATDVIGWCASLPWIGDITKYHLAKNLGADVAKPDRWLVRLAEASGETVDELCRRLAAATGDRVATVDVVLWRACAIGLLDVQGYADGLAELLPEHLRRGAL